MMAPKDPVLFYRRSDPNGFLSNFWTADQFCKVPPWVDGLAGAMLIFVSNEHFYQACKARSSDVFMWIRSAPNPYLAMCAGRSLRRGREFAEGWDGLRIGVMFDGLSAKFLGNRDLGERLIGTGDAVIHEDSPSDDFWGWRGCEECRGPHKVGATDTKIHNSPPKSGYGRDVLGRLLVRVRSELQTVRPGWGISKGGASVRIAVDFDGVLADIHGLVLALMNRDAGTAYGLSDWDHWFWCYETFGKERFWSAWDFIGDHDLRLSVAPFDGSLDVIRAFQAREWTVDVVTGNRQAGAASIRRWLDLHGVRGVKLISRDPATSRLSQYDPGDWSWKGELDYDVFIEDAPPFFEKVAQYPESDRKLWIVFDRPWNRSVKEENGIRRATSWSEVWTEVVLWQKESVKQ